MKRLRLCHLPIHSSLQKHKGLSLLELMITVAIASILLTAVGPNVRSILTSNDISGSINNLSGVLRFARHTSINEESEVVVCPSSNYSDCASDWSNTKIVFIDTDGNGNRGDDEELLASSDAVPSTLTLNGVSGSLLFKSDGSIDSNASLAITVCPDSEDEEYARALLVTSFGRITVSVDEDGDGVAEDDSGNALSCSSSE